MSEFVKRIKSQPGRYAITNPRAWMMQGQYFLVEVDTEGNIHQLNPQLERDGILDDEGWTGVGDDIVIDVRSLNVDTDECERVEVKE